MRRICLGEVFGGNHLLFIQRWISLENRINLVPAFPHCSNVVDSDSCALETRHAAEDFLVAHDDFFCPFQRSNASLYIVLY